MPFPSEGEVPEDCSWDLDGHSLLLAPFGVGFGATGDGKSRIVINEALLRSTDILILFWPQVDRPMNIWLKCLFQ